MATYTVHEPPLRNGETVSDPERFVFVRDGFHFWAFLLGPLWMLVHRMWLVLALYLAGNAALAVGLHMLHAWGGARFAVTVILALLIGLEAATLRRFSLRKWRGVGVVVGEDAEDAERRFFASWVERAPAAEPPAGPAVRRGPPVPSHVIGLFPEPGGSLGVSR
jgi:hypothetical protein